MNGGYEEIYKHSACVWGKDPGSLVRQIFALRPNFIPTQVLDAGCGEGKNSIHYALRGASVTAIDISAIAIAHAKSIWGTQPKIDWHIGDVNEFDCRPERFDLVIAYGLYHCLSSELQITQLANKLGSWTLPGGYHIVCCFNDRFQELGAHGAFRPTLLKHRDYHSIYTGWECILEDDSDLREAHPHNMIWHTHSMSRFIFRKHS